MYNFLTLAYFGSVNLYIFPQHDGNHVWLVLLQLKFFQHKLNWMFQEIFYLFILPCLSLLSMRPNISVSKKLHFWHFLKVVS